jgi:hypothetical protein
MEIERHTIVPGPPERAFALVDDLNAYPAWMDLVHEVSSAPTTDDRPVWDVVIQARVGPFARSKRLRMVRTTHDPVQRVVFERHEVDGRRHSPWRLAADLRPHASADGGTKLTMTLNYGGNLWTGAVLQRVLDDHVERGAAALRALVVESGRDVDPERSI